MPTNLSDFIGGSYIGYTGSQGPTGPLTDLSDVTISNPASGQLIVYNGTSSQWENTGSVSLDALGITTNGSISFVSDNATGIVQLQGPASVPDTLQVFNLPGDDGASGDVLTTDGNGNLSFSAPSGGARGQSIISSMIFG